MINARCAGSKKKESRNDLGDDAGADGFATLADRKT
jgi:hypothetical protein